MTSSAVVGSSAMMRLRLAGQRHGDHGALAHAAGELVRIGVTRLAASGMRTRPSSSTRHVHAAAHGVLRCRLIGSAICRPTVSDGLSELIGSWKIMAMRLPRIARISSSSASGGSAVEHDLAAEILPGGSGIRRRIDSAVTLLPEPEFAHDGQRLAGGQVEGDVVDRLDDAALGAESRGEAAGRCMRGRAMRWSDLAHRRVAASPLCRYSVAHLLLQLLVDPDAGVDRAGPHGAGAQLAP